MARKKEPNKPNPKLYYMLTNIRQPAVAGRFYDDDPGKLRNHLESLFAQAVDPLTNQNISAVILPHAGFVFSGQVAASGVNQLNPDNHFTTIFLLGASHRMGFDGASVFRGDAFATPLGEVPVDTEITQNLATISPFFGHDPRSHTDEHSLEVQLPFLQYHLKNPFKIVPILIGTRNASTCQAIAETLQPYLNQNNLFVISTDFSHYPNDHDARIIDQETLNAILSNNPDTLLRALAKHEKEKIPGLVTSLCGWTAVLTLLFITSQKSNIQFFPVLYQNSSDSPYGDFDQVVGYHSAIITSEEETGFTLSDEEKEWLLQLAREKIVSSFSLTGPSESRKIPPKLETPAGAFVSVYINDKLNGCIGHIGEDTPLWKVVEQSASSAAFDDSRFNPIKPEDLPDLKIEISVLTPLRKINDPEEIIPGKHGILIRKGINQGTFLPQVALRMNWSRQEMLEKCAHNKAGIGRDEWKDAELFVYEAIVFKEL